MNHTVFTQNMQNAWAQLTPSNGSRRMTTIVWYQIVEPIWHTKMSLDVRTKKNTFCGSRLRIIFGAWRLHHLLHNVEHSLMVRARLILNSSTVQYSSYFVDGPAGHPCQTVIRPSVRLPLYHKAVHLHVPVSGLAIIIIWTHFGRLAAAALNHSTHMTRTSLSHGFRQLYSDTMARHIWVGTSYWCLSFMRPDVLIMASRARQLRLDGSSGDVSWCMRKRS